MAITDAGENRAWELLAARQPDAVAARAGVAFDAVAGCYLLPAFGHRFSIRPVGRQLCGHEADSAAFLARHGAYFRLAALWYLIRATPTRPAGMLVRPAALSGGEIFARGTHVLPLVALAERYATSAAAFLAAGAAQGGSVAAYGDAAVQLLPLPKIPTTVILWTADEEFPARADLLFDATAPRHLPLDILWSVALLSVRSLL